MYFEFNCSSCSKKLKVREENIGGRVRCPYCHTTQTVQAPPAPDEPGPLDFVIQDTPATSGAASRPSTRRSAPKSTPATTHHPEEVVSATDVSMLKTGLVGFGAFVIIYAVTYPMRSMYLGALLWDRSWVQFAEMIMFTWAMAILFFKWRKLSVQQDSMLFDLLPEDISQEITVQSVDKFAKNIRELPVKPGECFLVNRVVRGLDHFRVLKNGSELSSRLSTQSDIDGNSVDSSYTLVKVFVWAIPILGFVGTVMGIGDAVGAFSSTMSAAGDMSALKDSFNTVTSGLGTAFDTTLLALVLSMFIMFPMSWLQKSEQDLLNSVDEYCNENLLKRVKDHDDGSAAASGDPQALQAAIDAAMTKHHAELRTWSKKLEAIGETLSHQVAKGWTKADEQMQERHQRVAKHLDKCVDTLGQAVTRLNTISEKQSDSLAQLGEGTRKVQGEIAASMQSSGEAMQRSAESLERYFGSLEQGIGSLNDVLAALDGKQVVINAPIVPRRRGLFSFGRRNGNGH